MKPNDVGNYPGKRKPAAQFNGGRALDGHTRFYRLADHYQTMAIEYGTFPRYKSHAAYQLARVTAAMPEAVHGLNRPVSLSALEKVNSVGPAEILNRSIHQAVEFVLKRIPEPTFTWRTRRKPSSPFRPLA